jgi:hypothetical protein
MALFDGLLSPEVQELLGGKGGLLGSSQSGAIGGGLLGGGLPGQAQRRPDSGLIEQIFGQGPGDPRGDAMSALSVGLLRGDFASGVEGANRALANARDRQERQHLSQLGLLKSGLELDGLLDNRKRQRGIRGDLDKLYQGDPPSPARTGFPGQLDAGADSYGTLNMGGIPMFSLPPVGSQQGAFPALSSPQPRPAFSAFGSPPSRAGAAPAPQRAELGDNLTQRLLQEAQVYARWGDYERAHKLYEQAAKWQPEVSQIGVAMVGGKPAQVITYKNGRQQVSDFGPTPKVHWLDRGDSLEAVDEYTMQRQGQPFKKGMTPSDRIAAGNLQVSRERLELERNTPQYMPSEDGGYIALPRRPGPGPIIGQAVAGPDGQPIQRPLKPIPANANTAILANAQNLKRAQDALTLVQGGTVGSAQGDSSATGWKGYAPNTALNIADPSGVDTRAAIADLGSMVIHDRSGAAVTAAEFPRLAPFIPRATDDAATVQKKLQRFVEVYQQEAQALGETYAKEQGYRPNPILQRNGQAGRGDAEQPRAGQTQPLPQNPTASSLKRGQSYTLPNGKTATWDGLQFKVQK